jgi:hypothetical protein
MRKELVDLIHEPCEGMGCPGIFITAAYFSKVFD